MKGLLLAGGYGTRLRPLTLTRNKHLIPIANKPMLLYGLEHLVNAGIKEIVVILGPIKDGIKEVIGDGSSFGAKIEYIEQPEPKGLTHAVLISESYIGDEPFVMYLGDNLLKEGVKPMVRTFLENKTDCVIAVKPVDNPSRYGIAELNNGKVIRLVEKPKQPKSNLAVIGVYVFNTCVFEAVKKISPSWRNELEIVDAVQYLVDHEKTVNVITLRDWWKDAGKPEDLLEANQLILQDLTTSIEGSVDEQSRIVGNVSIGKGTAIKNSCIRGPVIIGNNCEVGPGTYLGPYTSIGNNCRIMGVEIENAIVMDGALIEYGKRIVNSIIG